MPKTCFCHLVDGVTGLTKVCVAVMRAPPARALDSRTVSIGTHVHSCSTPLPPHMTHVFSASLQRRLCPCATRAPTSLALCVTTPTVGCVATDRDVVTSFVALIRRVVMFPFSSRDQIRDHGLVLFPKIFAMLGGGRTGDPAAVAECLVQFRRISIWPH